jgi:hypothetical protein
MVNRSFKHSLKTLVPQASAAEAKNPHKISASTEYNFNGKDLTPYGGLFPVATMLEKLQFKQLIEETVSVKRIPRRMPIYDFLLAILLSIYIGFFRLNQIRFVAKDPMLTGLLKVTELPPQSTFWRFLASLHLGVAEKLLKVQQRMRERVWAAANVGLSTITLDTDTTVHTLYGKQMGARKSYNPKNKGKKSYQPFSVRGGSNLETLWADRNQLQRSVSGERTVSATDGKTARYPLCGRRIFARPGDLVCKLISA